MIEGKNTNQSETSYRELTIDSSSSLREFCTDRKKYHKKYVLLQDVKEEESAAITIGNLVDTLLLREEEFDKKFLVSACVQEPTGLMLNFVNALVECTIRDREEQSDTPFDNLLRYAYQESGFKISYERVIDKFSGGDAEILYREKLETKLKDLTVVQANEVENAMNIVENLRSDPFVSPIVNLISNIRFSVRDQLQVEAFEIDDHLFKSMIDKVIIDHKKNTIRIYDVKCTWAVENFMYQYYLKRKAYIQGYVYYKALLSLTEKGKEFEGFEVEPPRFIVSDSIGYYKPLIYKMTEKSLKEAYEGFVYKRLEYPGVKDTIRDLKWAYENDTWDISRENFLSSGEVEINIDK